MTFWWHYEMLQVKIPRRSLREEEVDNGATCAACVAWLWNCSKYCCCCCHTKTWSIRRQNFKTLLTTYWAQSYKRDRRDDIEAQCSIAIPRSKMSSLQGKGLLLALLAWFTLLAVSLGWPAYGYRTERNGRSYTDIARVVNPNQYAFVGSRNYPGQPFWPAGR